MELLKYLGDKEVKETREEDGCLVVVCADGTECHFPKGSGAVVLTDIKSDATDLRTRTTGEVVKEIISVLLKWDTKIMDLPSIFVMLENSINESRNRADSKLYGKDARYEIRISDIDAVLNRHG